MIWRVLIWFSVFSISRIAESQHGVISPCFQCPSSEACISSDLTCNGKNDCPDGSDESYILCHKKKNGSPTSKCKRYEFHCGSGECIPDTWRCDKDQDCRDGSDENLNCEKKKFRRVCYFTNWAQYRQGMAKFTPRNIEPELCTHLIYAFANLEGTKLTPAEPNDLEMYKAFEVLKDQSNGLKTLLAVGGWNAESKGFSELVANAGSRRIFITDVISYLRKHGFNGLDIDWEYPTLRGGRPEDKYRFSQLIKELRAAFEKESEETGQPRLLLSAAVAAVPNVVDASYNVSALAQYLDFIDIMTYDFHGAWERTTGHNSPLYHRKEENEFQKKMNTDWAARYWNSSGAPRDKLNIGISTYGRSYILANPAKDFHIGAAVAKPGPKGMYTREVGFQSYYEICIQQDLGGGQTFRDVQQEVPYYVIRNKKLWIGFDDVDSVINKAKWIKDNGYGGAMIWSLSLDDFNRVCKGSTDRFPLTRAVYNTLQDHQEYFYPLEETTTTPLPTTTTTATTPATTTVKIVPPEVTPLAPPTTSQKPPMTTTTRRPLVTRPLITPIVTRTRVPVAPNRNNGKKKPILVSSAMKRYDYVCWFRPYGIYKDIQSSSHFYVCNLGRTFKFRCPGFLKFSSKEKTCVWPDNRQR